MNKELKRLYVKLLKYNWTVDICKKQPNGDIMVFITSPPSIYFPSSRSFRLTSTGTYTH